MNEDELEVSFEEDEYGQAMLFWYGMDKPRGPVVT